MQNSLKTVSFCVLLKTVKSFSFFQLTFFEIVSNKCRTYKEAYSLRFIHNMTLMNISSDTHASNLSNKIYNRKCRHCLKCKDCKKCNESKDDAVEWHKSKKTQIIVKNAKNIYVYCDCYPEYEKVTQNTHWVFKMWAA